MSLVLRIEVEGDEVMITGPRARVARAVDLSLCDYLEIDGYVQTVIRDPVPYAGRVRVNRAIAEVRGWMSPQKTQKAQKSDRINRIEGRGCHEG